MVMFISASFKLQAQETINIFSLLEEMADRSALSRFPASNYQSLQASSYNRRSTIRDQEDQGAAGWFADADGLGFIRIEGSEDRQEWVVMEHSGPGAITHIWAPYFHYGGLDSLVGPNIKVYLDGEEEPVINENFFKLILGKGSIPPPLAGKTARAGNTYFPIPFAKSCKITFDRKSFYNIINYRAYPPGTPVTSFTTEALEQVYPLINRTAQKLTSIYPEETANWSENVGMINPGEELELTINRPSAIDHLEIKLSSDQLLANPSILRSLILKMSFDDQWTVWVPLGDFFGSPDKINPFSTWTRIVRANGELICRWVMPFKNNVKVSLENLGSAPVNVEKLKIHTASYDWGESSLYFHANWRSDDILQGSKFSDWNFIDIQGKGVFVGDTWAVLNPALGWWGEGDEKIYVDAAYDRKFPTHFGTGTEDYYGWAGGEHPTKDDYFNHPFLANIEVGSATKKRRGVRGFNICTRIRSLDAIPFKERFVFDFEASPGVQIRNEWDFLGYSVVTFWYGSAETTSNRPPLPDAAKRPIMNLGQLDGMSLSITEKRYRVQGAIEAEYLNPLPNKDINVVTKSKKGLKVSNQEYVHISGGSGDYLTFSLTEQFEEATLSVQLLKGPEFGKVQFFVNNKKAGKVMDLHDRKEGVSGPIILGSFGQLNSAFNIRVELLGDKNSITKAGFDYILIDH